MTPLLFALAVLVSIVWLLLSIYLMVERNGLLGLSMLVVYLVLLAYLLAKVAVAEQETGPCLRYNTGVAYNAATKTMMPYRNCAERGEWTP